MMKLFQWSALSFALASLWSAPQANALTVDNIFITPRLEYAASATNIKVQWYIDPVTSGSRIALVPAGYSGAYNASHPYVTVSTMIDSATFTAGPSTNGFYDAVYYKNMGGGVFTEEARKSEVVRVMSSVPYLYSPNYYVNTFTQQTPAAFVTARNSKWLSPYVSDSADAALWDGIFDGLGTATDNRNNHLKWSSGFDDDWNVNWDVPEALPYAYTGYRPDCNGGGYLCVDRMTHTPERYMTGNIWTHEPRLKMKDDGVTVELRIKLESNSEQKAVAIVGIGEKYATQWGVHLSPNKITIGDINGSGTDYTFAFGSSFQTIRIVQEKAVGSNITIKVWTNGTYLGSNTQPLNTGYISPAVQTQYYFPRILVGDNVSTGGGGLSANYVLDYVKYRRGEHPGSLSYVTELLPPRIPQPAVSETWDGTLNSVADYQAAGYNDFTLTETTGGTEDGGSNPRVTHWYDQSASPSSYTNVCQSGGMPGVTGTSGITIETRFKVGANHQEGGWSMFFTDLIGDIGLSIAKDGVMLNTGDVGTGLAKADVNLYDGNFHTVRLVKLPAQPYWYVYVDNASAPIIADYKTSGGQGPQGCYPASGGAITVDTQMMMGYLGTPRFHAKSDLDIDYIRWHDGGNAPAGARINTNNTAWVRNVSDTFTVTVDGAQSGDWVGVVKTGKNYTDSGAAITWFNVNVGGSNTYTVLGNGRHDFVLYRGSTEIARLPDAVCVQTNASCNLMPTW